ncbi:hypothetical protein JCM10213_006065 [Rhodosporidiobolus nylandii]
MLLDNVVQPTVLSLFSSTSSDPTLLAHLKTDSATPSDSFISLLYDSGDSHETLLAWSASSAADLAARTASLATQRSNQDEGASEDAPPLKQLSGKVLHLQAPDCRTTSVRWGSWQEENWRKEGLGIELPVLHLQVKDLGQTMYVDVGILGEKGDVTLVRFSTWQPQPELLPATPSSPRLLHLPLTFPSSTASTTPLLTRWTTLTLPLSALLSSLPGQSRLKAVLGVEVHASCRLRRVWFSREGVPGEVGEVEISRGSMPEMAMFAAE